MKKLNSSKTILKMAGWRMYTPGPHPSPADPPLAMSYKNHQKSLAYFRYLAPLFFLFYYKAESKRGGMAQCPPKYAPALT